MTNLPYHTLTTKQSPNSNSPTFKIRANGNWSDESLKKTMKAMDKPSAKINMVIHHFGILEFFFKDHLNGKNKI